LTNTKKDVIIMLMKKEYLERFMTKCRGTVEALEQTTHGCNGKLSPWHLEDNVLAHTLMAYNEAVQNNVQDYVALAVLLHDIGKPHVWYMENDRKYFKGHAGFGAYLAVDLLPKISDHPGGAMWEDILSLIALHDSVYQLNYQKSVSNKSLNKMANKFMNQSHLFDALISVMECDKGGAIRKIDDSESLNEIISGIHWQIPKQPELNLSENKLCIMLIGPPCSGKSTWLEEHGDIYYDWTIISRDAIIESEVKGENYGDKFKNADQKEIDKKLNEKIKGAIKDGSDIIVDMTMMNRKSRRKILSGLPKDYSKRALVFYTGYEELLKRNANRTSFEGKHIPIPVINRMISNYHPPMYDEFDVIHSNIYVNKEKGE
jgi:predicted kinase